MKLDHSGDSVLLWLSPRDTARWANGYFGRGRWPCSTISGRRLFASFNSNGLNDLTIDGKYGIDVDGNEFNAITSDFLRGKVPVDHKCHFVTVGQFV